MQIYNRTQTNNNKWQTPTEHTTNTTDLRQQANRTPEPGHPSAGMPKPTLSGLQLAQFWSRRQAEKVLFTRRTRGTPYLDLPVLRRGGGRSGGGGSHRSRAYWRWPPTYWPRPPARKAMKTWMLLTVKCRSELAKLTRTCWTWADLCSCRVWSVWHEFGGSGLLLRRRAALLKVFSSQAHDPQKIRKSRGRANIIPQFPPRHQGCN